MAFISSFGPLELALYFFEDVDFSVQLPPSRDNYICKYKSSNMCGSKDVLIYKDMISRIEQCIPLPFYAG